MSPIQRVATIWLVAIGIVITGLSVAALFLYVYGPSIEPFVFGYVVKIPAADRAWRGYITRRETHREVEVSCFRLHGLRKLAPAVPTKYAFQIEAKLSDKINVSSYVADKDHQTSQDDLSTHPVGMVWDQSYCFEMPGTIADDQEIRVSGHAEHTRLVFGKPFPFWQSVTPIPEFLVKPVMCYRPDGTEDRKAKECRGD